MNNKEFLAEYGDLDVAFESYYKFTFTYSALLEDGSKLVIDAGDIDGDVYRDSFSAVEKVKGMELKGARIYKGKDVEWILDNH